MSPDRYQALIRSWACAARRGRSGTPPEGRAAHNERGGHHGMWESVIREAPRPHPLLASRIPDPAFRLLLDPASASCIRRRSGRRRETCTMPYWFEPQSVSVELGGKRLTIETGRHGEAGGRRRRRDVRRQRGARHRDHGHAARGHRLLPAHGGLRREDSAAGKIPGGFFKREARLSDREILVCRFIDRSIRPLFAEGFRDEVQVTATVLAHDGKNPPDLAAFIGASAALSLSQIPFLGPIGAVRLGRVEGEWVVNPDLRAAGGEQPRAGRGGLAPGAGHGRGRREGAVARREILAALQFAHREIQPLIDAAGRAGARGRQAEAGAGRAGRDRRPAPRACARRRGPPARRASRSAPRRERYAAIAAVEKEVVASFVDAYRKEPRRAGLARSGGGAPEGAAPAHGARRRTRSTSCARGLMRERILSDGVRIDGRGPADIRQIACEVRPLPRAHGVALFTRGETQALVYTTLGSSDDAQTIDALHARTEKHFLLHYNFPPFSVGEVRPLRGPSRRDIGHGNLAERALAAVLPERDDFPYTIRVVSEVLESNGSSSMATVCGGTLALMDAGVPLRAPVAGIAMGLIEEEGRHADPLRHPRRRGPPRRHGLQGRRHAQRHHRAADGHQDPQRRLEGDGGGARAGARGPAPHPRGDGARTRRRRCPASRRARSPRTGRRACT